jgi:hypothetical protein
LGIDKSSSRTRFITISIAPASVFQLNIADFIDKSDSGMSFSILLCMKNDRTVFSRDPNCIRIPKHNNAIAMPVDIPMIRKDVDRMIFSAHPDSGFTMSTEKDSFT